MSSDKVINDKLLWLTPEFLQPILNIQDEYKIKNIAYNSEINEGGNNYLSKVYKALVTCSKNLENEDKDYNIGLFIKILPAKLTERLKNMTAYTNEISMYKDTLKLLSLSLSGVKEYNGIDIDFGPKYYYSENMPPYNLIIEDLSLNGFLMGNRRKGLDIEHCIHVMKTLARFHAASIAVYSKEPKSIEKYKSHTFLDSSSVFAEPARRSFMYLADIVDGWPEFDKTYSDKLRMYSDTIISTLSHVFTINEEHKFRVLNHGDLWVNNIMFKYVGGNGEIEQVKFIDYQLSHFASPALDLQYFIYTSTTYEVRINHIDVLLKEYYKVLSETLLHLGHEVIKYEEFINEYESKSLYGLFISVFILPIILTDPENAADLSKTPDENNARRWNRLKNPVFTAVIKKLLPIFRQKNLI